MTSDFPAGNYRFIPAVFQYSSGAAANPGYEVERVRFDKMPPLAEGFALIKQVYRGGGTAADVVLRLRVALAGGVHRRRLPEIQPALRQDAGGMGPVRRDQPIRWRAAMSVPEIDPPAEPSFYAFSFTRPSTDTTPSFVIAGGAESRDGPGTYSERTVRYRDLSPDGLKEKVRFTVGSMESRLAAFGFGWKDTTAAQAYTVHDFHPVIADELVRRGVMRSGLIWHFARPPVVDLEYEMDCRRVMRETVI